MGFKELSSIQRKLYGNLEARHIPSWTDQRVCHYLTLAEIFPTKKYELNQERTFPWIRNETGADEREYLKECLNKRFQTRHLILVAEAT